MSIASYIDNGEGVTRTAKPKEPAMTNEYIDYFDFVKSDNKKSIFSNPEIKQMIFAIAGNAKMKKIDFPDKNQEKIAKTYMRMYFSLVMVRWCRGETLGVARQKSLEQMNNYVKSKENDSIGKDLIKMKEQFHPEFAKINMMDKQNADKNINIDSGLAKELEDGFSKEFKQSLQTLNNMSQKRTMEKTLEKQMPEKPKEQKIEKFENGQQKARELLQKMLMQQMMNQRAA